MQVVSLLWLLLVLAFGAWLAAVVGTSVLAKLTAVSPLSPLARRRRVWLAAWFPLAFPTVVVAAAIALAGAKAIGWTADHCLHHDSSHPHFCFSHLPALDLTSLAALMTAAIVLVVAVVLARGLWNESMAVSKAASLKNLARGKGVLRILEESRPWAFAAGIRQPFVLVSTGLRQNLDARERRVLVGHEFAHLRHGDPLGLFLLELLLLLHISWTARQLRQAMQQAMEELADDKVALRFGAYPVAALLLKVARLSCNQPANVMAASGADPIHRARRLLFTQHQPDSGAAFEWGYAAFLLATFALVVTTHHTFETLLGFLV